MRSVSSVALVLAIASAATAPIATAQNAFVQIDLVSDLAGRAPVMDANLVNPWGIVPAPNGVFWVANQGTGTSTLYQPDGTKLPLDVIVAGGAPTGIARADSADLPFEIPVEDTTYRASFIFVSLNGRVTAWGGPDPTAAVEVARDSAAVYTGVAIASVGGEPRLYAADFAGGKIDVYDRFFDAVDLGPGTFADPQLPAGYVPFNVALIEGELYVAYALQGAAGAVPGPGNGYVDVYNLSGQLIRRFSSTGALNAPWAMVRAVPGFGDLGGSLLVGNFGDGRINVFDFGNGNLMSALQDTLGNFIVLPGLWGLSFGPDDQGERALYFAAGIDNETHGLFGFLEPAVEDTVPPDPGPDPDGECDDAKPLSFWRNACRGHGHGHGHGLDLVPADVLSHDRDRDRDRFPADSLEALLACVEDESPVFGEDGCFAASCDLLTNSRHRSHRKKAAQELLALMLNRCAGLICDSLVVSCRGDDDDHDDDCDDDEDGDDGDDEGDDDDDDDGDRRGGGRHRVAQFDGRHGDDDDDDDDCDDGDPGDLPVTVGEIISFAESTLCAGGSDHTMRRVRHLLKCANHSGDRDDDDEDDGDDDGDDEGDDEDDDGNDRRRGDRRRISCSMLSANPLSLSREPAARFELTSTEPSAVNVRMRVYDAAGRLVAELLRDAPVTGRLEVRWDGIDERGTAAAPGIYFYRATTPDGAATSGRFVLMR